MCMTSTLPRELMVTRPLALGMQPAFTAPAERTILKVVFCASALMLIKLSTRPVTNERLFFTVVFSSSICFVFYICVCALLCLVAFRARVATRSRRPALIQTGGFRPFLFLPASQQEAGHSHLARSSSGT